MKIYVLFVVFLFINKGFTQKDTLSKTALNKGKKILAYNAGYGYLTRNDEYAGYSHSQSVEFEYFLLNKLSLTNVIGYSYSYSMFETSINDLRYNVVFKKYIRIKSNYNFSIHNAYAFQQRYYKYLSEAQGHTSYQDFGISPSLGFGFHWFPKRNKKIRLSKFGFNLNLSLWSYQPERYKIMPYSSLGVKYRIN